MDLSIIIVNWNSKEYLQKCIESVVVSIQGIEYEIVVIDSGSFDGCGEMLKKHYPKVHFIQSEKNLGFAKANNTAFNVSSGRNILFLNPDTEIEGSAVNTLYNQLNSLPDAGIVGAKLLNSDRSVQTSCIQSFPTILNQLLDSNALRNVFPRAKMWGMRPLFTEENKPVEVDAVSGACLMIKRSAFKTVGMFSPDYFMYSEDIDLCYKVKQAGFKIFYAGDAQVVHHGGGSTMQKNENYFSNVLMKESRFIFFSKTKGQIYARLYKASMTFVSLIRLMILFFLLPWVVTSKKNSLYHSFGKWNKVLKWSLGLEK